MSGSVFLNEKNIMSYSVRPTVFRFLRSLKPPDPNPELEEAKTVFKSVTKRPIDIAVIRYALSWFSRPSEAAQYVEEIFFIRETQGSGGASGGHLTVQY
ncbi:hypothetical protein Moror_5676 [Moniliophthora roreri MCA 2997]|uniref:Uncharacterized protein n=1 Tax=Moniliophthora roreri (strain MCA 2997) TaxID=1381753 RepID=V2WR94_MONRO|nr:hypothetical protein Moror_5676 [Moniliophthora roreri MCA 2997]